MLITRRKTPPGGWKFRQAETRWENPMPLAGSFEEAVERIIKHRQANPRFNLPTDFETVSTELDNFTCLRLNNDPKQCTDAGGAAKKALALLRQGRLQAGSGSAAGGSSVKRIAAGVQLLVHWLGSGGEPVGQELADARASVCSDCPLNTKGDWKAMFTVPVAEQVRKQLEMRQALKLTTKYDDKLHVCLACLCPLRLKVHAPTEHILDYTASSVWNALDPGCWMTKEKHEAEAQAKKEEIPQDVQEANRL